MHPKWVRFLSRQLVLPLVLLFLLQNSLWVNVQHGKHGENPETWKYRQPMGMIKFHRVRLPNVWICWCELRKLTNVSNLRAVLRPNRLTNLSSRLQNNPWIFHRSSTSELVSPRLVFGREQLVTDFRPKKKYWSVQCHTTCFSHVVFGPVIWRSRSFHDNNVPLRNPAILSLIHYEPSIQPFLFLVVVPFGCTTAMIACVMRNLEIMTR